MTEILVAAIIAGIPPTISVLFTRRQLRAQLAEALTEISTLKAVVIELQAKINASH